MDDVITEFNAVLQRISICEDYTEKFRHTIAISRMPFLLGELVQLELALCTPAKNRTAAIIAAGIRSFINTANSRDFDCVQLRTNGERALAAMAMELASLGPGQHMPVVERKIQTIKKRVRHTRTAFHMS